MLIAVHADKGSAPACMPDFARLAERRIYSETDGRIRLTEIDGSERKLDGRQALVKAILNRERILDGRQA